MPLRLQSPSVQLKRSMPTGFLRLVRQTARWACRCRLLVGSCPSSLGAASVMRGARRASSQLVSFLRGGLTLRSSSVPFPSLNFQERS